VHAKGFDLEDDGLAMTLAHAVRGCFVCRQVNLLASLRLQPGGQDRFDESRCGPVVQHGRRLLMR
jgi:hypothetical protein